MTLEPDRRLTVRLLLTPDLVRLIRLPSLPVHQRPIIAVGAHRVPFTTEVRPLLQGVVQLPLLRAVQAIHPAVATIQLRREVLRAVVLQPIPPPAEAVPPPPVPLEVAAEAAVVADVALVEVVVEVVDVPVEVAGNQMN